MAETRISDVIVPEVFAPYVVEKSVEKSAFFQSGIISKEGRLEIGARKGGETVNMPYWNDLEGDAEELSDQMDLSLNNITAGQDVSVLQALGKAFAADDLAGALTGDDPVASIGDLVAGFWIRNMQKRTIKALEGAFAASNMSDNVYDISALSGDSAVISKSSFTDARWVLGDESPELTAVAMHSSTKKKLEQLDLIDTERGSDGFEFETYQGKKVHVDDGLPVSDGVYTTYLFAKGAVGYGEGIVKYPAETDRDSLGGKDVLISRRHIILHPRGVKWIGSATISTGDGTSGHPTLTDLATGTNWTRVYDNKKIRIVAFKHRVIAA